MSVLRRFSYRGKNYFKQVLVGSHPADLPYLRTDAKTYLLGTDNSLPYHHENYTSLEDATFVIVLGKKEEDLPDLLLNLAPELCQCEPNGELAELVLKMHKLTPPKEQALLWQRYFYALAQATPDAQDVFRRMAQNLGVIPTVFIERKYVKTNHFNPVTGHIIDWTSKARGHNFGGFLK
jgi:hypothetical protein